jgi:hypothetical protein
VKKGAIQGFPSIHLKLVPEIFNPGPSSKMAIRHRACGSSNSLKHLYTTKENTTVSESPTLSSNDVPQ